MFKSVVKDEITVPAQFESVVKLRDHITRIFHKNKVDDTVTNAFKLSIDEAATNIIKHGYDGSQGSITLRTFIYRDRVTVHLIDDGKYFDPMRVREPDLNYYVKTRKKGGLGIFIIRKFMDSLEYNRTYEGNVLKLTKSRQGKRKINVSVSPMSITLKARYSLISSAILTAIVIIGYVYNHFKHESAIKKEHLNTGITICETLARTLTTDIEEKGLFNDFTIVPKVNEKKTEFEELIHAIIIVQPNKNVYYSTDTKIIGKYIRDDQAEIITENIKLVTLTSQIKVYDISSEIYDLDGDSIGFAHVLLKWAYIDELIQKERTDDLTTALFVLIFGYIGIVVVIYMIMSPFQKLAEWVRALGHGDEVQEQMDISDSGEIGEIARAFSDITTKFKDSQKRLVRQEQLQKEMQVAKEIQQTLLPTEFPKIESYEIGAFYEAAKEVGGDYFDFVQVDNESLGIVVADVSGKGVPGSLVMTMIRTALRTEARNMKLADNVLSKVNSFVVNDMKKGMFVTVFYVIIDAKRRRLNYASAGHNPMILYRGSSKKTYFLNPRGFPIGISLAEMDLFARSIESDSVQLKEDDILLLYTDGITEAMNRRREMFGEERLLKVIREYGHLPVQPFVEKIRNEVHSFTEGFPQNDDITLVVIKEESSAEKVELKRAKNAHKLIQNGNSIRSACEEAGITTYAYYNKYKRKFEEEGIENIEVEDESISLEAKHLSIEEKTKIYDIIRSHPEFGPKRISEELNTEKYGFTEIKESRIYDELVRSRLNTKQLREAFIKRSKRGKRIKPPGTPLLTLDGEVIIDKTPAFEAPLEAETEPIPEVETPAEKPTQKSYSEFTDAETFLLNPLENVLNKQGIGDSIITEEKISHQTVETDESRGTVKEQLPVAEPESESVPEIDFKEAEPPDETTQETDFSFEELLGDGDSLFRESEFEETSAEAGSAFTSQKEAGTSEAKPAFPERAADSEETAALESDQPLEIEEAFSLAAVDDILKTDALWEGHDFVTYEEEAALPNEEEDPEVAEDSLTGSTPDLNHDPPQRRDEISEIEEAVTEPEAMRRAESQIKSEAIPPQPESDEVADQFDIDIREETAIDDSDNAFSDILTKIDDEIAELLENRNNDDELTAAIEAEISSSEDDNHHHQPHNAPMKPGDSRHEKMTPGASQSATSEKESYEKVLLRGLAYYRKGLYDLAIEQFKTVLKRHPESKEAHSILGNAYFRNKMFHQAAAEYQKVKALDPNNLDAYENMGVIYANFGEYEKAISEWEYVLELNPKRQDIKNNIERASHLLQEKMINQFN